jgi:hypothetical protein
MLSYLGMNGRARNPPRQQAARLIREAVSESVKRQLCFKRSDVRLKQRHVNGHMGMLHV